MSLSAESDILTNCQYCTLPGKRKQIFNRIKAGGSGGAPGQWSARKAQMVAKAYKAAGGGYK